MLRLPLTASQWLVALMGLASSASGSVCGVVAVESVGLDWLPDEDEEQCLVQTTRAVANLAVTPENRRRVVE